MICTNDGTPVTGDFAPLDHLGARDLHMLAWMVDHHEQGTLLETAISRLAIRVLANGKFEFEAPREAWNAAVDLRVALRATPESAATSTGLPAHVIAAFAAGLGSR